MEPSDVEAVARLARLSLTPDEVVSYASELTKILDLAEDLAELDLDGIPVTSHPLELTNVFRPDVVKPSLGAEAALAGAPAAEDGRFSVPRMLPQ